MRNIFFSIPFFVLIAISSCTNKDKYVAEIKCLDSLQNILNTISIEFRKTDTVVVAAKRDSIVSYLTFIHNNYNDTMPRETAIFLQEYRSIKKPLDVYLKEAREITEELEYSEKQTKSLIHDLKNNLLEEEKAKQYFDDERNSMDRLIAKINMLNGLAGENLKKFDELLPKVEGELENLRNVK